MNAVCATDSIGSLDDPTRLDALMQTALLDSPREEAYDRLTRLAAKVLRAPIALVSLVDNGRQFFMSSYGLPEPVASARETPLSQSFCQHVVTSGRPLVISDSRTDPLVADNGAVALGIIAYAGIPLITPEGLVLGSFCAIDTQPREWTDEEIDLLRDLAASVMAEIALRRAKATADEANRAKDRFLAFLSHELRTPLTPALLTAASMAADPALPAEARADALMIHRNIELTARLTDDLLDITRITHGKLQLRLESVEVHALLQATRDLCCSDAEKKQIGLSLELNATQHTVRGDGARLQQVFCNLVKNAIKFTPAGGSVSMQTSDGPRGSLQIAVKDTGVGVDADLLPRMFEPFEQGKGSFTRQNSGLGLGLAICRGIVDSHGGRILAASEGKGHGATLTVELPAAVAAVRPKPAAPLRNGGVKPSLKILLVDDHHDTLFAMSKLLRRMEHRVTTADSVTAALAAADAQHFDLLISDVGLPDGTGLDLMRQLLAQRPIKGIALTGYGTESDIENTRAAGFLAHLTKPIDFKQLETMISNAGA